MMLVMVDRSQVQQAHEIVLPLNHAMRKKLVYRNEVSRVTRFTVQSSDPAIVTVQTPELVLNALEERPVELLFHALPQNIFSACHSEVYIFFHSEDRVVQESRL